MDYKQLKQPNLTIQGKAGWCLSVAQDVWNVPHLYPKAIDAWNDSSADNHPDELPPNNVCVILYWTFTLEGIQFGHIATWVPGRGVYSSPLNVSYGSEWYPSVQAMTNRINQIAGANSKYLGWSESLSQVKLVTKEGSTVAQIGNGENWYARLNKLHIMVRGRELDRATFNAYLGKDTLTFIEDVCDGPEADAVQHAREIGQLALKDDWQGQIYGLIDKLNATQIALQNEQNKPAKEVIKEVEKIIEKPVEVIKEVVVEKPVYTHDKETAEATQTILKNTNTIKGVVYNIWGVVKKLTGAK